VSCLLFCLVALRFSFANKVCRIGPRKLLRVITDVQDSIITRQPGDYFSQTLTPNTPRPRMIRGDSDILQSPEVTSRFAANVRRADVQLSNDHIRLPSTSKPSTIKSLPIIPETVEATREDTSDPPLRSTPGHTLDLSVKRERPPGQTVLLVEDNDINMRVRLSWNHSSHSSHLLTTVPPASPGLDEQAWIRLRMCDKRPRGIGKVQNRPVGILPRSHGYEHASSSFLPLSPDLNQL
jgi:hypothetical protein